MSLFIEEAGKARTAAEAASRTARNIAAVGLISAVIGIAALGISLGVLYLDLHRFVDDTRRVVFERLDQHDEELSDLRGALPPQPN